MSETSPGGGVDVVDGGVKCRKDCHLAASRSSLTRWSWLVTLWTTVGLAAAALFVVGEAGYGNRRLPKPFAVPPVDPQLSASLPDLQLPASTLFDQSELDSNHNVERLKRGLDEFESTLPLDVEIRPSSSTKEENQNDERQDGNDVIISTPLTMKNRLLVRLKRSPTGSAAGLKDEELPSPVFVREEHGFPGLTLNDSEEPFLKQLFTSTVSRWANNGEGEPTVATLGGKGMDGSSSEHLDILPSSSLSASSSNHHNPWEDVHQVGLPQPSAVVSTDMNSHHSSSVMTVDTPHPAAILDDTGSLALVPTDFRPDEGSSMIQLGETISGELLHSGGMSPSSLVDDQQQHHHHEEKARADGLRKSARRLDVDSASKEQELLMNVADKRAFKHPDFVDEDEFAFEEHHQQPKDSHDEKHPSNQHEDPSHQNHEDPSHHQPETHQEIPRDHFHDFDSQALPAAPLIHSSEVIPSSDPLIEEVSTPSSASSTTLKSSEWFNFDSSSISTENNGQQVGSHGGTTGDEAGFHVMDDGLDGQTTEDSDVGTLMESSSSVKTMVKKEEVVTMTASTTAATTTMTKQEVVDPLELLDPNKPVEILPLAVSHDMDDMSKFSNDGKKATNATTTTTSTEATTVTKKKPLMPSDKSELEDEEEDLLVRIMESANGTTSTTQRTTRSTTLSSSPTTTPYLSNDSSIRDQKAHQSGPGPPFESTSTTRVPPSLIVEGRRRGVEKFNQPQTRWRMTKGEVLAVVLGTAAAVLVILGSLALVLYKRRLGLKFAFQFQRQALTDHSGSNNGSSHSPEDGNSGSSPLPPPHSSSVSASTTPNGVSFGLGQLSANLSRGLGLSSSSASASSSSRHRQQNGSRSHRPSRRATSFYAGVSRRLGGLASGVAAYASDGHSNHHIDLGQGNMDELNFQPAYMARNLESPRDGGMVDDFTNLDNDSFLNSLEFVNFAKINSQFGHTKL